MASAIFKNGVTCNIEKSGPRKRVNCTDGWIGEWSFSATDDVLFQEYANGQNTQIDIEATNDLEASGGVAPEVTPEPEINVIGDVESGDTVQLDQGTDSYDPPPPVSTEPELPIGPSFFFHSDPVTILQGNQRTPNAEAKKIIYNVARSGYTKGESRSSDSLNNRKYPKGFTPPVDFYTEKAPIQDAKERNSGQPLTNADKGVYDGNSGGVDSKTGRPIEYGISLTRNLGNGLESVSGGTKYITRLPLQRDSQGNVQLISSGIDSYNVYLMQRVDVDLEMLKPINRYFDPQNIGYFGQPLEYGHSIRNLADSFDNSTPLIKLEQKTGNLITGTGSNSFSGTYEAYMDYGSKEFNHLYDWFIDENGLRSSRRIRGVDWLTRYGNEEPELFSKIYLANYFVQTFHDNEDPTILGFDVRIKTVNSPLFNNTILNFIRTYGANYLEIASREEMYKRFINQLLKFIPSDIDSDNPKLAKRYYLQSITGLDKLVESLGPDTKQFVDYGKDILTLEFLEDVSQNMGYLASLYKTLQWSRINGKLMIPPNLLKFDLEIKITEMRNYRRNVKDSSDEKIYSFNDKISTYYYTVYDCEFLFDKMPHGDAVYNNKIDTLENFKLNLTYKFATSRFVRYDGKVQVNPDGTAKIKYFVINNFRRNLLVPRTNEEIPTSTVFKLDEFPRLSTYQQKLQKDAIKPTSNDLATSNIPDVPVDPEPSEIELLFEQEENRSAAGNYDPAVNQNTAPPPIAEDTLSDPKQQQLSDAQLSSLSNTSTIRKAIMDKAEQNSKDDTYLRSKYPFDLTDNFTNRVNSATVDTPPQGQERSFFNDPLLQNLKTGLKNAVANQVNRVIVERARLLNDTIDEIRNKLPFAGRISEPTNVYTSTNAFRNDIINSLRNFVGGSIASFFKKPI